MRMDYHTTTQLWLSLEDFHNAGMTPDQTRAVIERISDPYGPANVRLSCDPMGVNSNWIVRTFASTKNAHVVAEEIQFALEYELQKMLKPAVAPRVPRPRLRVRDNP
jgi:hypothetical protein